MSASAALLGVLLAALVVGAYLLGGVPFGLVLARRFAGADVRAAGSGNIGATNVARVAGKKLGVVTLLLDALKGAAPVLAVLLVADALDVEDGATRLWAAAAGLAAVLGHCFSPFLRLKGGKGVATSFGVFLVVAPWAALAVFAVYAVLYAALRVSSIGSLVAAALLPVLTFLTAPAVYGWLAVLVVAVVVLKHRGNIARLVRRQETRV